MTETKDTICGLSGPYHIEGHPLFVCLRTPNHRGDHSCEVKAAWPASNIIENGSVLMSIRYHGGKARQRYISMALERQKKHEETP